jgi:hypothetical protein
MLVGFRSILWFAVWDVKHVSFVFGAWDAIHACYVLACHVWIIAESCYTKFVFLKQCGVRYTSSGQFSISDYVARMYIYTIPFSIFCCEVVCGIY